MKPFLTLFFVALAFVGFSQSIAEKENQIPSASGVEKISLLLDVAQHYSRSNIGKALRHAREAEKLAQKQSVPSEIKGRIYGTLGELYFRDKRNKQALEYYKKELHVINSSDLDEGKMRVNYNLGTIQRRRNKNSEAIKYFKESLRLAQKMKRNSMVIQTCKTLIDIYSNDIGRHIESIKYYEIMFETQYAAKSREQMEQIEVMQSNYQKVRDEFEKTETQLDNTNRQLYKTKKEREELSQKTEQMEGAIDTLEEESQKKEKVIKEKEKDIKKKNELLRLREAQLKSEQQIRWLFIAIISIVVLASLLLFNLLLKNRRAYKKLQYYTAELKTQKEEIEKQKNQIEEQRDTIERQNTDLLDSIAYAKRIQIAMLPDTLEAQKILGQHFILFKPRDVVSGDFFWYFKTHDKVLVAAADCTGHGVPGAFMSMLGMTFLNDTVKHRGITQPDKILNNLRKEVIEALRQAPEGESKDGMDITLIAIDRKKMVVDVAGAYNPLYHISSSKGELKQVKADKMPIAIHHRMDPFTKKQIKVEKNDMIYLFSDGYADQIGGNSMQKFMYAPFRELLTEVHNKTMLSQETILEERFEKWRGDFDQIDDVIVMGIRI